MANCPNCGASDQNRLQWKIWPGLKFNAPLPVLKMDYNLVDPIPVSVSGKGLKRLLGMIKTVNAKLRDAIDLILELLPDDLSYQNPDAATAEWCWKCNNKFFRLDK